MTSVAIPAQRGSTWPVVLGSVSIVYVLLSILHALTQFAIAAFGPVLAGVGGDRPPIAPTELRWHGALEAIFCFALAIMLFCAASNLLRQRRNGALMIGLWAVSSIVVHLIFLAWAMSLEETRAHYQATAEIWREHAAMNGLGNARPFGPYEPVIDWSMRTTNLILAVPFIYPICVGLVMLTPSVRRDTAEWN